MSVSAISTPLPIGSLLEPLSAGGAGAPAPEELRKAAAQFEAIMVRQLLAPTMNSMLSSIGGSGGPGSDVYGHLMTDALANSLSGGSGLGLSNIIELQLRVPAVADTPSAS